MSVTGSKKSQDIPRKERLGWIAPHNSVSIARQCELAGVSRAAYYREPATESPQNLELMREIDELYTRHPFYGSRRIAWTLWQPDRPVNRKRVQRLMGVMGIEAIYPKPRLSAVHPEHRIYPYLLRDLTIDRCDQVWSTDITYIPMRYGFMYLVAVMDWFSRTVLSWELSNTLDTTFCISALESALRHGTPEIFNTDQGSQFTSNSFTELLKGAGIRISMDGRGRWADNVFIERLWRSVKYEEVYLKEYDDVPHLIGSLDRYFRFYNAERPHQSLQNQTPLDFYRAHAGQSCLVGIS